MRMLRFTRCLALVGACAICLSTAGCVHSEVAEADNTPAADSVSSAEEAAAMLGNPMLANKGDINSVNVNVSTTEELEKYSNGSEEELIWTDPDNPDAEIPGLTEAFENRRSGTGWQDSYAQATRLARQQELPLVIWFHDSALSAKSKELAKDYFNTKEFDAWSRDKVVRLRLDSGTAISDESGDTVRYSPQKISALKRTYGVRARPAVVIISPNGKVAARLEGYDGVLIPYAREFEQGVTQAEQEYKVYKEGLRRRGFRDWRSSRNGKSLFAKLLRVDDQRQTVYLKEPGGRVSRTRISNLSREDINYLDAERRKSEQKRLKKESEGLL